jgi:hypothetical protein
MAGSIDTWGIRHLEDLENSSIRLVARLAADIRFRLHKRFTFSEEGSSHDQRRRCNVEEKLTIRPALLPRWLKQAPHCPEAASLTARGLVDSIGPSAYTVLRWRRLGHCVRVVLTSRAERDEHTWLGC